MTLELCFWILMLIWAIFFCTWTFGGTFVGPYGPMGNSLLIFVLFCLLGWKVFGPALHG